MLIDKLTRCPAMGLGPITQPTRQPLMAWDLDRLLIVAVRSAMPGRLAGLMCSPSYSRSL
ncbi:hypothetical protein D3C75_1059280 [compost metagenome]